MVAGYRHLSYMSMKNPGDFVLPAGIRPGKFGSNGGTELPLFGVR